MENQVTNGKAIAGLVLGIVAIFFSFFGFFGIIIAIVGLIFAILGLQNIKKLGQKGKGIAVAGIVCNSIAFVFAIGFMILGYLLFQSMDPSQLPEASLIYMNQ